MDTDTLTRPGVNHAPIPQIDGDMPAVIDDVAALHTIDAYRHKGTVIVPIHRVVRLPKKPTMVIGVVDTHIHARGIEALQHKARAIDGATRRGRVGLDISRTNILIGTLDKGIDAVVSCGIDRDTRRRYIGELARTIAWKPYRQATYLGVVRRVLITNLRRTFGRKSAPRLSSGASIRPELDIGSIRGGPVAYLQDLIAASRNNLDSTLPHFETPLLRVRPIPLPLLNISAIRIGTVENIKWVSRATSRKRVPTAADATDPNTLA